MNSFQWRRAAVVVLAIAPLAACNQAMTANPEQIVSEVRTAVDAHWEAINNADDTAISSHHTGNFRAIMPDYEAPFAEGSSAYDALGSTQTLRVLGDVHIEPLGSDVAVASFLMEGTMTWPDGRVDARARQVTEVWQREGDVWKEAHHHDSVYSPSMARDPLAGAWAVTAIGDASGASLDPAGPGQFIFANGRYSAVFTIDVTERTPSVAAFDPTDEEKVAQYDTIIVNSGTYEIDGDRVTLRPLVAKSPEYIGGSSTMIFQVDGDVLTTSTQTLDSASGDSPGDAVGNTMRLRRAR